MDCEKSQMQISESIDTGDALSQDVLAHLQSCEACREFRQDALALEQELGDSAPRSETPEGLHGRIMDAIQKEKQPVPIAAWWKPLLAVAAAIVIATGIVLLYPNDDRPNRQAGTPPAGPDMQTAQHVLADTVPDIDDTMSELDQDFEAAATAVYADELDKLKADFQDVATFLLAAEDAQ